MESNSVSPMPENNAQAPMAEFDKTPPTPPEDTLPMEDLPPPPTNATVVTVQEEKEKEAQAEAHRHYEDDNEWGCGSWLEYTVVVVLASVLLLGSLGLTLYWTFVYRDGFAWRENPAKEFNLHPVLMVAGFITFSGFSVLLYRICRCCRRIYVKLLHTVFHALAIPCIALGFLAVLDSHNLAQPPIPNFYSLHSWIGLTAMGLFAIQFVVGFFSFLILLCCEGATAGFRAALVPIHASFGLTTFILAIAAALTGLTEKALFELGERYPKWENEGIIMNALGVSFVALAILVTYAVRSNNLKSDVKMATLDHM
ncbi:plasma membrane ascorbate-dependent reductase CYBRD1 isoform X2 [Anthonomus grandis grandis]|uniref:plasma membrane ascorbate-dependent reductase CYBRD1 isoform X2 n=1 Tax=Anthonomus grandis grandis TaxID=2921223 RepID=UPI002166A83C|nr:plasma membrane ascorbate-dependent reductase CYBRD1 isoform X2 [Anthonomus grandis grandis]